METPAFSTLRSSQPSPARPSDGVIRRLFSVTRTGVLLILVGHLLACVAVIALMSGGWPMTSVQTLGYRVLPLVVGVMLLAILIWRPLRPADLLMLAFFLGAWATLGIGSLVLFEVSGRWLFVGAFTCSAVLLLAIASRIRADRPRRLSLLLAPIAVGLASAVPVLRLLAAPPLSTHPLGDSFAQSESTTSERRNIRLDDALAIDTTGATLTVTAGRRIVYIEPLLTFNQRSPDGCWTIFAPRGARVPMRRELLSTDRPDDANVRAAYRDGADWKRGEHGEEVVSHDLQVTRTNQGSYDISAVSSLSDAIYSHLNTFTQITVAGHKNLSITFSPAPETKTDVRNVGYPIGSPSRFAYVDRDSVFHIVEASSAEKGPFRELAAGRVDGPLTVTLFDGDDAFLVVRLDDWAAQASVEPSPTAGWGLPQNAIEFSLLSADPKSPATIFLSLASTSVGRGWNSVGHAAGVYRNRMSIVVPAAGR